MLGEMLARLLDRAGQDEVVRLDPGDAAEAAGDYDAAIVTIHLPDDVHADLVIELPSNDSGTSRGAVIDHDHREVIDLDGTNRLLDVLDERCASPRSRQAALACATGQPEG
jgi:hypothetical protein